MHTGSGRLQEHEIPPPEYFDTAIKTEATLVDKKMHLKRPVSSAFRATCLSSNDQSMSNLPSNSRKRLEDYHEQRPFSTLFSAGPVWENANPNRLSAHTRHPSSVLFQRTPSKKGEFVCQRNSSAASRPGNLQPRRVGQPRIRTSKTRIPSRQDSVIASQKSPKRMRITVNSIENQINCTSVAVMQQQFEETRSSTKTFA